MTLLDRDLEYFLAIASHASLAQAAVSLDVSQPTLSRSIQRLERHFGVPLLERTALGVEPTEAGSRLLKRAQVAKVALDDISREIKELADGLAGHARVASGYTLWPLVSGALVPQLRIERPVSTLTLDVMIADEILQVVEAGEYDFGVCVLPSELPFALEAEELMRDELVPVVRKGHPLTARGATLAELRKYPWIGFRSKVGTYDAVVAMFNEEGLAAPEYAVETSIYEVALQAAARSDFVTMAPKWLAGWRPGGFTSLEVLDLPGVAYRRHIGIVTRRHAYLGPIAQRAMQLIRETLLQVQSRSQE
ncbi:LysR family transcriptional regulator [Paraburkholderia acidipaludis]|uniref:LysR family transcriptional regulator n=1 Tax=Paraburkholderia acidipaludis TaxID=660537 RepID=UPI0004889E04|nr:LysR family transcriptional regulator [Paraburkholderia acidipaludis]